VVGSFSSSRAAEVPSEEASEVASSVEGGERRGGGEVEGDGGDGEVDGLVVKRGMRGGGERGREEDGLLDRERGGEWEEDREEGWPGMEVAEARRG